jgi:DNA-binding GntR family transcriptional regulator
MKLSEIAYRRFKERLFALEVRPGQFLSQRELMRLTGTTLGPMREALQKLELEGLVQIIPQRGIQVVEANLRLIRNAFQLRMVLEKEAARHFALHGSREAIATLEARHRSVLARAADADEELLAEAQDVDWSLHDSLIDSLGNELVSAVHRVNSDRIRLIRLDHGLLTAANLESAMEEHLAVLAACRARDPEAAAAALERHLTTAMRRAMGL